MWCLGTYVVGLAVLGLELDLVIFKIFSNLNNSVILCWCFRGLKSSKKEQEKWKNNSYRSIVSCKSILSFFKQKL